MKETKKNKIELKIKEKKRVFFIEFEIKEKDLKGQRRGRRMKRVSKRLC